MRPASPSTGTPRRGAARGLPCSIWTRAGPGDQLRWQDHPDRQRGWLVMRAPTLGRRDGSASREDSVDALRPRGRIQPRRQERSWDLPQPGDVLATAWTSPAGGQIRDGNTTHREALRTSVRVPFSLARSALSLERAHSAGMVGPFSSGITSSCTGTSLSRSPADRRPIRDYLADCLVTSRWITAAPSGP